MSLKTFFMSCLFSAFLFMGFFFNLSIFQYLSWAWMGIVFILTLIGFFMAVDENTNFYCEFRKSLKSYSFFAMLVTPLPFTAINIYLLSGYETQYFYVFMAVINLIGISIAYFNNKTINI